MAEKTYIVTESWVRKVEETMAIVRSISGAGVTRTPTSISIAPPPPAPPLQPPPQPQFVICKVYASLGFSYYSGWKVRRTNSTAINIGTNLNMDITFTGGGIGTDDEVVIANMWENASGKNVMPLSAANDYAFGMLTGELASSGKPLVFGYLIPASVLMSVRITKDGGSDGSAGVKASWTYTVKLSDDSGTLETSRALDRDRPTGAAVYTGVGHTYGAWSRSVLWDVGEIYQGENA